VGRCVDHTPKVAKQTSPGRCENVQQLEAVSGTSTGLWYRENNLYPCFSSRLIRPSALDDDGSTDESSARRTFNIYHVPLQRGYPAHITGTGTVHHVSIML